MGENVHHLRNSDELLERAVYWAVSASWLRADDFEQAQADAQELRQLHQKVQAMEEVIKQMASLLDGHWLDGAAVAGNKERWKPFEDAWKRLGALGKEAPDA